MILTEAKLKQLIVEVLNEVKAMPKPPAGFPMDKIEKINNLINSDIEGDVDQAHSIMSAFTVFHLRVLFVGDGCGCIATQLCTDIEYPYTTNGHYLAPCGR